jgi:hypothetical protein
VSLWDGICTIESQTWHLDAMRWWLLWVNRILCWWPCDSIQGSKGHYRHANNHLRLQAQGDRPYWLPPWHILH